MEIFTLRGRFLEQAHTGDTVVVNGKLEQIYDQTTNEFSQRIVIGTDRRDKMIQINKSKEKFN
jgi:predicted nucleotidyltransferase